MCMCDLMLHVLTPNFNAVHTHNINHLTTQAIADFHCIYLSMQWMALLGHHRVLQNTYHILTLMSFKSHWENCLHSTCTLA